MAREFAREQQSAPGTPSSVESSPVAAPARRGPGTYDRRQSAEQRRQQQKHQLLSAAAHVFARDGYASASVASILETSGLSRGTFYRHFRDLRHAFLSVQQESARVLYERIEQAFLSESDPPAQLTASIAAYLGLLEERADLARVFHREARLIGPEHSDLRRQNLDRLVDLFRRGLAEAKSRGLVERVPDDLTLFACVVAIEGVGMRYLEEHREREAIEAAPVLERLCFKAFA